LRFLENRRGLLDAVVVSGGEPTLQAGLDNLLRQIRRLGFAVKLDTNGTRPKVLADLIGQRLVDFVAMDLKGPLEMYPEIYGVSVDASAIRESIGIIVKSGIAHEFRTTVIPQLTILDLREMVSDFEGIGSLVLQQYLVPERNGHFDPRLSITPHRDSQLKAWADELNATVGQCYVRGIH